MRLDLATENKNQQLLSSLFSYHYDFSLACVQKPTGLVSRSSLRPAASAGQISLSSSSSSSHPMTLAGSQQQSDFCSFTNRDGNLRASQQEPEEQQHRSWQCTPGHNNGSQEMQKVLRPGRYLLLQLRFVFILGAKMFSAFSPKAIRPSRQRPLPCLLLLWEGLTIPGSATAQVPLSPPYPTFQAAPSKGEGFCW